MKYFVVGMHGSGKQELANLLLEENIPYGKLFTNMPKLGMRFDEFDDKDIIELFENKAYIFIKEADEYTRNAYKGISLYEFDNNNVFLLSPDEFTAIPSNYLEGDNCIIWLDDNATNRKRRYNEEKQTYSFNEQEEFERRDLDEFVKHIYNNPKFRILYFTNDDIARISSILYAIIKYPDLIKNFEKNFK